MHPIWRFTFTAIAAAAIALGILSIPLLFRGGEAAPPRPTPAPGLRAKAIELKTMPDVADATRRKANAQIAIALVRLYKLAYAQPHPAPDATPGPRPSKRITSAFTKIARTALAKSPNVFDEGADISVHGGTVAYSGVVTFEGKRPLEAMLEINFLAEGTPPARSPVVRVNQRGTLVLKNTPDGWLVDGFDLRFATRPIPEPTPR
jgi:hypothetical protein